MTSNEPVTSSIEGLAAYLKSAAQEDFASWVRVQQRAQASATSAPAAQPSIVQVEAAKLRLVTDRRLGKKSPEWLRRIARGLPAQEPVAAAATPQVYVQD